MKKFKRLREEMKKRGVNGKTLAAAIGVKPAALSGMLSGRVRWNLQDACKVLEVLGYNGTTMLSVLFPMDDLKSCHQRSSREESKTA